MKFERVVMIIAQTFSIMGTDDQGLPVGHGGNNHISALEHARVLILSKFVL